MSCISLLQIFDNHYLRVHWEKLWISICFTLLYWNRCQLQQYNIGWAIAINTVCYKKPRNQNTAYTVNASPFYHLPLTLTSANEKGFVLCRLLSVSFTICELVSFYVCLLAGITKNWWMDLHYIILFFHLSLCLHINFDSIKFVGSRNTL